MTVLLLYPLRDLAEFRAHLQGVRQIPVDRAAGRRRSSPVSPSPGPSNGHQLSPGAPPTNPHPKRLLLRRCGLHGAQAEGQPCGSVPGSFLVATTARPSNDL